MGNWGAGVIQGILRGHRAGLFSAGHLTRCVPAGSSQPWELGVTSPVLTPVFTMRKYKLSNGPSRGTLRSAEGGVQTQAPGPERRFCTAVWSRCLQAAGEEGAGQHFPAAPAALMPLCPLAATTTPRLPAQPLTDGSAGDSAAGLRQTGGPPGPLAGLRAPRLHTTMEKCPPHRPACRRSPSSTQRKRAPREDAKDSRLTTSPSSWATTSTPRALSQPRPHGRPLLWSPSHGHNTGTGAMVIPGRPPGRGAG